MNLTLIGKKPKLLVRRSSASMGTPQTLAINGPLWWSKSFAAVQACSTTWSVSVFLATNNDPPKTNHLYKYIYIYIFVPGVYSFRSDYNLQSDSKITFVLSLRL